MAGGNDTYEAAIDPAFVIFRRVYVQWWTEGKNPHVPRLAQIQELMNHMSPSEAEMFRAGARLVGAYGHAMVEYADAVQKMSSQKR